MFMLRCRRAATGNDQQLLMVRWPWYHGMAMAETTLRKLAQLQMVRQQRAAASKIQVAQVLPGRPGARGRRRR